MLHCDLRRDDEMLYFTTCGWMMWNWLVSGLAVGCEVLLYDGSPLAPEAAKSCSTWRSRARHDCLRNQPALSRRHSRSPASKPAKTHNLLALCTDPLDRLAVERRELRLRLSEIKPDVCLSNISGGTDLCACFATGNPTAPVYRGETADAGPGHAACWSTTTRGDRVVGQKGELVCAAPFPSVPLGFWSDPEGKAFSRAYFERFPGVWHHGDFAELTERDTMIIYGRSDAVLNPGGVRIGTAEIYRQVEQVPEVLESIVVGQDWKGDVRMVLFVKLRPRLRARRTSASADQRPDSQRTRARGTCRQESSPWPTSLARAAAKSWSWLSATAFTAAGRKISKRSPTPKRFASLRIFPSCPLDACSRLRHGQRGRQWYDGSRAGRETLWSMRNARTVS